MEYGRSLPYDVGRHAQWSTMEILGEAKFFIHSAAIGALGCSVPTRILKTSSDQ